MKTRFLSILSAAVVALAACSGDKSPEQGRSEDDAPWAPAQLTRVKGVPAAEIESALRAALDKGTRPEKIDEEQWGHTRSLYKAYGNQALWLAPDGLHEDRAYALAN